MVAYENPGFDGRSLESELRGVPFDLNMLLCLQFVPQSGRGSADIE